jgi:hypothetical protein
MSKDFELHKLVVHTSASSRSFNLGVLARPPLKCWSVGAGIDLDQRTRSQAMSNPLLVRLSSHSGQSCSQSRKEDSSAGTDVEDYKKDDSSE